MSPRAARPAPARSLWAGPGLAQGQEVARFHRQHDRRRLRTMVRGLCCAGVLVPLVLGGVGLRVQQIHLSYQLDRLRAAKADLEESRSRLRVEIYTLTSLGRIEGKARAELGMVPPASNQVRLAREFVPGGGHAAAPLTASAEDPRRLEPGVR